jgi:hypothetical protein
MSNCVICNGRTSEDDKDEDYEKVDKPASRTDDVLGFVDEGLAVTVEFFIGMSPSADNLRGRGCFGWRGGDKGQRENARKAEEKEESQSLESSHAAVGLRTEREEKHDLTEAAAKQHRDKTRVERGLECGASSLRLRLLSLSLSPPPPNRHDTQQ